MNRRFKHDERHVSICEGFQCGETRSFERKFGEEVNCEAYQSSSVLQQGNPESHADTKLSTLHDIIEL
jgi:hypothetical protein